mmetsp:Transcript_76576/g.212706  ORF Transcript_76576/g.212706 Transcript_76576/m.212706 type:complete len:324 (-) Transcript_76576:35-1006(-)
MRLRRGIFLTLLAVRRGELAAAANRPGWRLCVGSWESDLTDVRDVLGRLAKLHELPRGRGHARCGAGAGRRGRFAARARVVMVAPVIIWPLRTRGKVSGTRTADLNAKTLHEKNIEIVGNLPPELLVHVIEHTSQKLLGVLLRVAREGGVQLSDRQQNVLRRMVMRCDGLGPVALEPICECHQQLLSCTLAFRGVSMAAKAEILLQAVRVRQALQRGIHEACVAQVSEPEHAFPILLLTLARIAKSAFLDMAGSSLCWRGSRPALWSVAHPGVSQLRALSVASGFDGRIELLMVVVDLIAFDRCEVHQLQGSRPSGSNETHRD